MGYASEDSWKTVHDFQSVLLILTLSKRKTKNLLFQGLYISWGHGAANFMQISKDSV